MKEITLKNFIACSVAYPNTFFHIVLNLNKWDFSIPYNIPPILNLI